MATVAAALVFGRAGGALPLRKVAEFDLPGPEGKRFDYLTMDADDHYLLAAHMSADQTYVIDVRTNDVIATITDTPRVEGVEYVSGLKKVYTGAPTPRRSTNCTSPMNEARPKLSWTCKRTRS